jgi:hypothetical protein
VNKAVDEYIALRGDKEMTDEEAEAFAAKNSIIIQNAVKKSFIVRVVSIAASLVVAFLSDWFHPLATIVPILAYQPIITWGNHICEVVEKIIARVENEKTKEHSAKEVSDSDAVEPIAIDPDDDAIDESVAEEGSNISESETGEIISDSESDVEDTVENSEDTTAEETFDENESTTLEENEENTEGSDLNEL